MKTAKVKIALEINSDGDWIAYGYSSQGDDDWASVMDAFDALEGHHVRRHWIEAEVQVPEDAPATAKGEVVPAC